MVYLDATGLYHFVINVIPFISNSVVNTLYYGLGYPTGDNKTVPPRLTWRVKWKTTQTTSTS